MKSTFSRANSGWAFGQGVGRNRSGPRSLSWVFQTKSDGRESGWTDDGGWRVDGCIDSQMGGGV